MASQRIEALLQFLADDPDDPFTRFALAQEWRKAGDTTRALETYERLAADRPDYVGTYYHLGKLYVEMNRADDAERAYRDGISAARRARDTHALAELQDALLQLQGAGFDD